MPSKRTAGNATELDIEPGIVTLNVQMALDLGSLKSRDNSNNTAGQAPRVSPANAGTGFIGDPVVRSD